MNSNSIPITVPRLGWSMEEGTFVGWLKKPGETVKAGDPLFTLENEKASQDVESADSGVLRLSATPPQAGDVVKVGAVLGYLDGAGGDATSAAPSPRQPAVEEPAATLMPQAGAPTAASEPGILGTPADAPRALISPRARRRAVELGVDWSRLQGSGRTGRIVELDILEAAKKPAPSNLSTMRLLIAKRTAESFATVPHFYLRTEVDATLLLQARDRLLPEIQQATGVRLTLTDLILWAQARALRECPFANSIWQDNRIVALSGCDAGLVVGLPDGLIIPIVRCADCADLAALASQRAALVGAARAGRLPNEALKGGATSLSNLGNTCVDEFSAVIPIPHSSVLAVGRAATRPVVVLGQLAMRPTLRLCLSVDHRVMDGGPAAEFLGRIVAGLEKPESPL